MILVIDNFDSFTYNLVDYFNQLGVVCDVKRNTIMPSELSLNIYEAAVLSPGPGNPQKAGNLMEIIKVMDDSLPILGICLGHQALGEYYGAQLKHALKPMHGKVSAIQKLENDEILEEFPDHWDVVRYHSLVLEGLERTDLVPLAQSNEKELMVMKHRSKSIYGIQYHPEAVLTDYGLEILAKWYEIAVKSKDITKAIC